MQPRKPYGKEVMNHDFKVKIVSTGEYSGCLWVVEKDDWLSQFRWGTWEKAMEYIALIKDLPNYREG